MLEIAIDAALPASIEALPAGEYLLRLTGGGGALSVRLVKSPTPEGLVVVFHGAADRTKRKLPIHITLPSLHGRAHILAVSDPGLERAPDLRLGWFQGYEGFDAMHWLRQAVVYIRAGLGISKTVYFGSSGGGFAALLASHADPYSIVVAGNPQSVLPAYSPAMLDHYLKVCWPATHAAGAPAAGVICDDVGEQRYRGGHPNFVIYIQSSGDRVHFERQMIPFVAAMKGVPHKNRFILDSGFRGHLGHVNESEAYLRWIETVLDCSDVTCDTLLTQWYRRQAAEAVPVAAPVTAETAEKRPSRGYAATDMAIAARLAAWNTPVIPSDGGDEDETV